MAEHSINRLSKCYAAAIGGCGGKPDSKEHPLTEGLLLRLGDLEVEAPWTHGVSKPMTAATMTARVLCEAHNNKLSPFDSEICKLFDTLLASKRKQLTTWVSIDGGHIERWALKVLFAQVATGMVFNLDGTRPPKEHPPDEWLRILYEGQPFPLGCGLHYSTTPFRKTDAVLATFNNFSPKHDRFPEMLYGISVQMLGFYFTTNIAPIDAAEHKLMYRPKAFSSWDSETAGIIFKWDAVSNS